MILQDQKKFQELQHTDQESVFGSKPSPSSRPVGTKKVVGPRANGGPNGTPRRLSLNSHQNGRSAVKDAKRDPRPVAPLNYVEVSKEDAASHVSGTGSGSDLIPASP